MCSSPVGDGAKRTRTLTWRGYDRVRSIEVSSTTTRRDRREMQRRQRARRPHGPAPQRRPRVGGIWIGLGLLVLAVGLVLAAQLLGVFRAGPPPVNLNDPKYGVDQVIGTKYPDEGNSHLQAGQRANYKQNPPTSGDHWPQPQAPTPWGIKDVQLPNEVVVHNLEHGGVVIFYKGLTAEETDKVKDVVRLLTANGFKKIVLEPYADMSDARIALSAWDWGLKLPSYDDVQIVKFVKSHYDGPDAPERGVP
jgi:hypothetical protein